MSDLSISDQRWRSQALCAVVDPDVFFDEVHEFRAKAICGRCPARDDCLRTALRDPLGDLLDGVWGGTTRGDRRKLRKAALVASERASA